jgi:transposase
MRISSLLAIVMDPSRLMDLCHSIPARFPEGGCRQAAAAASYSPDFNPIEQVFAERKTLLRKAAERTVDETWRRVGPCAKRGSIRLSAFSPDP